VLSTAEYRNAPHSTPRRRQARSARAGTGADDRHPYQGGGLLHSTVVQRLKGASGQDPRLVEAARQARDGQLTQYLAGAPALLNQPPAGSAVLGGAAAHTRGGPGAGSCGVAAASPTGRRRCGRW
jgi:hypothetical protein